MYMFCSFLIYYASIYVKNFMLTLVCDTNVKLYFTECETFPDLKLSERYRQVKHEMERLIKLSS